MTEVEILPGIRRNYDFMKYVDGDAITVLKRISSICRKNMEITYKESGIVVYTFDCGDIIVDVVAGERGVTMYAGSPYLERAKKVGFLAGVVGGVISAVVVLLGFGGYYWISAGVFGGIGSWALSMYFQFGKRDVIEIYESLRSLPEGE